MSDKKSQAIIKRDSVQNWAKAVNYVPEFGTVIVYDFDDGSVGLKIADGRSLVGDLPFLNPISEKNRSKVMNNTLFL